MPTFYYQYKNVFPEIKYYKDTLQSFKVSFTSGATVLKHDGNTYIYSSGEMGIKLFSMLRKIKKELDENEQIILNSPYAKNAYKVKYYDFNKSLDYVAKDAGIITSYTDVIEADITGAYYRAALNLGFISQKTFNECMKLKKSYRLKLLGMIATKKVVEEYENGVLIYEDILVNELHRKAWFTICSYVETAMQTLIYLFNKIDKRIFLFYWVDGIYFKNFGCKETNVLYTHFFAELSKVFSFDWKFKHLDKIEVENHLNFMTLNVYKDGEEKPKVFIKPNKDVKYYGLYDGNNLIDHSSITVNISDLLNN